MEHCCLLDFSRRLQKILRFHYLPFMPGVTRPSLWVGYPMSTPSGKFMSQIESRKFENSSHISNGDMYRQEKTLQILLQEECHHDNSFPLSCGGRDLHDYLDHQTLGLHIHLLLQLFYQKQESTLLESTRSRKKAKTSRTKATCESEI